MDARELHRLRTSDSRFDTRLGWADRWLREAPRVVADAYLCVEGIISAGWDLINSLEEGKYESCAESIAQLHADVKKLESCLSEISPSIDATNHGACTWQDFCCASWSEVALQYGQRLREVIFEKLFSSESCVDLDDFEKVFGPDLERLSSIDGGRVRDGRDGLEEILQGHCVETGSQYDEYDVLVANVRQELCRVIVTTDKDAGKGSENGESSNAGGEKAGVGKNGKRRETVNDRMKAEMASDLEGTKGLTAKEWAARLDCKPTAVKESETWKSLQLLRAKAKAERTLDRNRR